MTKRGIWFADLTHTAQGISAATFPLGVSCVLSYAKQQLGSEFEFRLFKFPSHLDEALRNQTPAMLCFSNYSWNFELAYKFAFLAKGQHPNMIAVFGGPNFPTDQLEKMEFLRKRSAIDFYIELEGELGFVDLVERLVRHDFDTTRLKSQAESPLNTSYLWGDRLVSGRSERIRDVNVIPSPYLTGALDEYFDLPLVPMIETTRGCPFSCTFCADGIEAKNKVFRYDSQRTREELHYIASKVQDVDELIITDLNFAMYKEDLVTAEAIADIQRTYKYPTLVSASAGKNKPQRTIEVASIIEGWTLGASIQSTDPEVLSAIKRSNISSSAYRDLVEYGNSIKNSKTHSEIILGLPGDTKAKHLESLRFGIDNSVNSIRMFQAMLLAGTEMASEADRERFGLVTKFRTIPGCIGIYHIFDEQHSVAEVEEIIVGNNTLTAEDYVDCRVMNLIVETFYNNAIFEEFFSMVRSVGVSPFDCLIYLKDHPELYSQKVGQIIRGFLAETTEDLFDTFEQAQNYVLTPTVIERYVGGELGTNELLLHRALLFSEFEDICDLLFRSIKETLRAKALLTAKIEGYLDDLKLFTVMRKKDPFGNTGAVTSSTFDYDFEAIRGAGFRIDPNLFPALETPVQFEFFHDDSQKKHISNQVKMYSNNAIGLGKLIQRSNLKLIFRDFRKSQTVRQP